MRPLGIGLAAAFVIALVSASPSFAAKALKDPMQLAMEQAKHKQGMTEGPKVVAAAGLPCTVVDATWMGDAVGADKVKSHIYEVACLEGLGYVLISKEKVDKPELYDCVLTSTPTPDGKPGSLACTLPGNANPALGLQPLVDKTGHHCSVDKARYVGQTATKAFYEVSCKGAAGVVIDSTLPVSAKSEVGAISCASFEQGGKACQLTSKDDNIAPIKALAQKSVPTCQVTDQRYVLSTTDGADFWEVACGDKSGFILQVGAGGDAVKTVPCANASYIGGGCGLTDAREAETQEAATYSGLARKAGFDCTVAKYAPFPISSTDKEVVELQCSNRPDGGVGIFPTTSAGAKPKVLDCIRSQAAGYKCSYTSTSTLYPKLTEQLKAAGKTTCVVSDARVIGRTDKSDFVEVACADGLSGWVVEYPNDSTVVADVLNCQQAASVGGGCKLPSNVKK